MAYYRITGGKPLHGTISVSGAKNAALPIICATVLTGEKCRIENLPDIEDVHSILMILEDLGATVERPSTDVAIIDPTTINKLRVSMAMASKLRASYYMLGALLGRYGYAHIALPGGCPIGERPINFHINGMRLLGADVRDVDSESTPQQVQYALELLEPGSEVSSEEQRSGFVIASGKELHGGEIFLDMPSVGATINIMFAAVRAEGRTIINNAAREPHVVDVANFLSACGATIRGAGTDVIRITGTKKLHGCTYAIIPDQIETGTYMIAAAATKGDVIIKNVIPAHLEAISAKLMECGVEVTEGDTGREFFLRVRAKERPRACNIRTLPYPGFATDLQQPMTALLSVAIGSSVIVENLFENRFMHTRQLNRMGANIRLDGRMAIVSGVEKLYGTEIEATDLRAGAAMIVAALMADGTSIIRSIIHIDRGYEKLDEKLRALGADIERVEE